MFLMVIETKFHIKRMPLEIGSGDELGTIIFFFFFFLIGTYSGYY